MKEHDEQKCSDTNSGFCTEKAKMLDNLRRTTQDIVRVRKTLTNADPSNIELATVMDGAESMAHDLNESFAEDKHVKKIEIIALQLFLLYVDMLMTTIAVPESSSQNDEKSNEEMKERVLKERMFMKGKRID